MHVLTGGSEFSYELKPLAEKFLGISNQDEIDLLDSIRKGRREGRKKGWALAEELKGDCWLADPDLCRKYAIMDAKRTLMLYMIGKEKLEADPDLVKVYRREMRLWPVVKSMEDTGTRVFRRDLKQLETFYNNYMVKQRALADKEGGKGLNFNSHKQLAKVFFEKRGHKIKKHTEAGNPSMDASVLVQLAQKDSLAKCILEFRTAKHAMTGFITPYNRFRVKESPKTWVIHPNFRQTGPVTGRFRCGDPNLMQVAANDGVKNKSSIELRPREAFGPRKDCLWYLPDYSQMEVWGFASLAQDKLMLDVLMSGKDIHGSLAEKVWGKKEDFRENFKKYRAHAKLMTWCKLYGGGPRAVAEQLGVSEAEAKQLIFEYDEEIPGINLYIKRTVNLSDRQGFVKNPYGRIYYIDKHFGYKAVNYMVQGTCADILKVSMIRVQKLLNEFPGCQILLTLHDELVIEIPLKHHSKSLMKKIVLAMQRGHSKILKIPVPLPVDISITKTRWSDVTDLCRKHFNPITDKNAKECVEKGCNHA
jgi:DNA polymerase-1